MKALLIEDDLAVGELLADALGSFHWAVERAFDGESGLDLAQTQDYDVILLDIGLPRLDGITVCKKLRSQGCQTPILLLTGRNSTDEQVAGLDAGADDYVTKPFDLNVVLARVRSLARKGKSPTSVMTWQTIQLDPVSREVTCKGAPVRLTAKEYGLFELFLLNPKRIYSRRAILDHLWDIADAPGEETVSTHIKCLRQKLKAAGASDPIETVHGLGYRLRSALLSPPELPQSEPEHGAEDGGQLSQHRALDPFSPQAKAQAVTLKVWHRFKTQYLEQVNTLQALLTTLKPDVVSPQQYESQQLAHTLIGSMGMFGLLEASQHARKIEQLMKVPALDAGQIMEAFEEVQFLHRAIAQVQDLLPPKLQSLPVQSVLPSQQAQILVVDDDLLLADRLRIEAIAWSLQVEIATDLAVARQMIAQHRPDIILLDLTFPGEENGLTLMRELEQQEPNVPVVIFSASEDLCDRVAASRLGVSAFLQKPLPAYEILKTITDVLYRSAHLTPMDRVLMVDDDLGFLTMLSELLSEEGLQVTTCANPQDFWTSLVACNPQVVLLDLVMPEFDGVELCQVIRADPRWQHLKVLFLSAHTEPEAIARAYAAGADDYISKMLPPLELVTRILFRIGIKTDTAQHLP